MIDSGALTYQHLRVGVLAVGMVSLDDLLAALSQQGRPIRIPPIREGRLSSRWLQRYIRDHGGVMNLSTWNVVAG